MNKILQDKYILWLIILVAAILRFYHFTQIPFTHDEFSALFRTHFDSFGELIQKGVKIDGHPAGIQVFLYYYTQWFGTHTWVVKLPFLISGVLSVWILYKIGKTWYNPSVGLFAAGFLATSQIAVMYSQIARPYSTGLFFSLAMFYFWSGMIRTPDRNFWRNRILYILFAALCAYNHYFSLLFAIILGLVGIFITEPKHRWAYMASGVAVFLLFVPHLSIFLYQIQLGGVEEWLNKPTPTFFSNYLGYIFNFSSPEYFLVGALVLFGIWKSNFSQFSFKKLLLFVVLFFAPLIIGYIYSIKFSAVLQFSVLLFSTPYLFFALYGQIPLQKPAINLLIVIAILGIGSYGLISDRHHYSVFYKSHYSHILTDFQDAEAHYPNLSALILSNAKITESYTSSLSINPDYTDLSSFSGKPDLIAFLEREHHVKDHLYLGCISSIDPAIVPIIQDYFPHLVWQKNYFTGTTFLFSKSGMRIGKLIADLDFETPPETRWQNIIPDQIEDSVVYSSPNAYFVSTLDEWSVSYSIPLDSIMENENNFIDISLEARAAIMPFDFQLVATLDTDGENIYWGSSSPIDFMNPQFPSEWVRVHHSIKLSDVNIQSKDVDLKCFVWNNKRQEFFIDNFQISLRTGNPIIYGLFEPIPHDYHPD